MFELPKIGDPESGEGLFCPKCGSYYLHHNVVKVYSREGGEDGLSTMISVDGDVVEQIPNATDNPSNRRNGIAIGFTCENCDLNAELTIVQHKGVTHVEWREPVTKRFRMVVRKAWEDGE
jgi:hypothetical protein